MSIIDKIKTIKDAPEINICMMGPRSVGKTTIMTSIFYEMSEGLSDTKLYMAFTNPAENGKMGAFYQSLRRAVERQNPSELPASYSEEQFRFDIGLKGRQPSVKLVVQDYPGEYLANQSEKVREFVQRSQIVLVAIDTPYLMETDQDCNEARNQIKVVTEYLTGNVDTIKNKLVLLVPLKCERYAHDGRIEEVSEKVSSVYGGLKDSFVQNNIACIVTPIQTLGGIELDKMVDNPDALDGVWMKSIYRSYAAAPKYTPLFCRQPFYYLLAYTACHTEWQQAHTSGSFIDRLLSALGAYLKKDKDFYSEIRGLQSKLFYNEKGFKTITTNTILRLS